MVMSGCIRMLVHLIRRSIDAATFKFVKILAESQSIDASNAVQLGGPAERQKTLLYRGPRNCTSSKLGYC